MKLDDLIRSLSRYGLSEAEARVFLQLSKLGESTATVVAKEAGLSRAEVYRAADGLESRGLLQRTVDRPQRFIARPIEDALHSMLAARRAELGDLEAQREAVVRFWPKRAGPDELDAQRFHVSSGKTQIEGILGRMLARAEREVAIAAPHRTINRLISWGFGALCSEAAARGVSVRIVTQLTEDMLRPGALPEGAEIRHSEVPTYAQFVIVDQKEIAIYATVDPVVGSTGRPETVLWLNSPDFTMGQQTLFDEMWIQSMHPDVRRAELASGRRPHHIDVLRGRFPRIDEVRTVAARAEKTLRVAAPEASDLFVGDRAITALRRAAAKGIHVRLLSPQPVAPLVGVAGIEQRVGHIDARVGVLLGDDAEVMVVPVDAKGAASEERSFVGTVPALVAMFSALFDAAWTRGT